MAIDFSKYSAPKIKPLPVILLLDTSGSMLGDKIANLQSAVEDMVATFIAQESKEIKIQLAVITFGENVNFLWKKPIYVPVRDVQIPRMDAKGSTPMGTAITAAKDVIEDKDATHDCKLPVVVLVSDGRPNDEWREPLNQFISGGKSQRCQRFALAIGADADRNVLKMFTQNEENVLYANDAKYIADRFRLISMTISSQAHSGRATGTQVNPSWNAAPSQSMNNFDDDDPMF